MKNTCRLVLENTLVVSRARSGRNWYLWMLMVSKIWLDTALLALTRIQINDNFHERKFLLQKLILKNPQNFYRPYRITIDSLRGALKRITGSFGNYSQKADPLQPHFQKPLVQKNMSYFAFQTLRSLIVFHTKNHFLSVFWHIHLAQGIGDPPLPLQGKTPK